MWLGSKSQVIDEDELEIENEVEAVQDEAKEDEDEDEAGDELEGAFAAISKSLLSSLY